jgi:hypothetical protein
MTPHATAMALVGVHNLTIDEEALRAHVLRPPHVKGVIGQGPTGRHAAAQGAHPRGPELPRRR